jgi:hypothetical protein
MIDRAAERAGACAVFQLTYVVHTPLALER